MSNPDELLTTKQVAELTGWSVTSVNRWALLGELPTAQKLPGRSGAYLFRRSEIQQTLRLRDEASAIREPVAS